MLSDYQKRISNIKLWEQALTHSSYTKDHPNVSDNERLEFLGDAVLKLIFSQYLFRRFPEFDEGILTKYRSRLISDSLLAQIAKNLEIFKLLKVSHTLNKNKLPSSILGNTIEALIGVIYLDQGFELAESFVMEHWTESIINSAIEDSISTDYKSILQELLQSTYKKLPEYQTITAEGPDHNKVFEVSVSFEGKILGIGRGNSKKTASLNAAQKALDALNNSRNTLSESNTHS